MLRLHQAATRLGISKFTLRKWATDGTIKYSWTPTHQRIFSVQDIDDAIGKVQQKRTTIISYCRVSSSKQRDDLVRQKQFLASNIPNKYSRSKLVQISDIGSGLNFKRPGLLHLLEQVQQGNISAIIVASKDRLCRFGYELIEWMCSQHDTTIVVLNNQNTTPESELGEDLMAIVQVYCCRWNGRRRYKSRDSQSSQASSQADSSSETSA
jgi:predicted site-specific integrase-resolvase